MKKKIKTAIISIGNELLRGFTVNTNLTYIGDTLSKQKSQIIFVFMMVANNQSGQRERQL